MIRSKLQRKGRFFPDDKIVGGELMSFYFFFGNLYARVCGRIYPAVQTKHTQGYCDDVLDMGQGEFRGDLAHHCVRIPIKDTLLYQIILFNARFARFSVFYERIN